MTPALPIAILKTIRSAGFCVGWCRLVDGHHVVNAVHGQTLESFVAHGEDEQTAWIALAEQIGFDMEE